MTWRLLDWEGATEMAAFNPENPGEKQWFGEGLKQTCAEETPCLTPGVEVSREHPQRERHIR